MWPKGSISRWWERRRRLRLYDAAMRTGHLAFTAGHAPTDNVTKSAIGAGLAEILRRVDVYMVQKYGAAAVLAGLEPRWNELAEAIGP